MADAVHYRYLNARGTCLYHVVRSVPKRFAIFDASGRPLERFPDHTVLYRLAELLAADPGQLVYITEGKKDADCLAGLRLISTTNPGGCQLGWKDDYTQFLRGRRVIILADHDAHRVGVQRIISKLTRRSLLTRENGRLMICWDRML